MSKKLFRSKTDPYPLAARIFAQLRDLDENEGWYGECLVNILMFCTVAINLDRLDGDAHVLIANAYLLTAFRAAQKDNRELYTGNMMRCAAVIYEWKTNPKMISREREMGEKIYREVMSGDLDPKPAFQNKEVYHLAVPDLSDADIQSKEDKFSDAERLYRVWHLVRNQGIPLAIRNLQLGLTESPNNPTFHALLGNLYSWLRLYDEAEGEFRTVKRLDPKHDVHLPVATVYLAQNKLDKAISEFEVSLRIEPKNWDAHFLLARSYHKKGRLKDALREYRIFVQNDESKPKAITHSLIGEISYKLGQLDEAIKEFQQSLNTKHNTTEHSQQETLIDAFHAALHDENKLNEGEIHFILGKCYERKGEKDLSIREFEIAKRLGYQAT